MEVLWPPCELYSYYGMPMAVRTHVLSQTCSDHYLLEVRHVVCFLQIYDSGERG